MDNREKELRAEYFDGPASDSMSLMQFFLSKGFDPKKVTKGKKMAKGGVIRKYKHGGEVPEPYKGFSQLPEKVQQKMNPDLAAKYKHGGLVPKRKV
jgi:hypothetical protein